MARLLYQSKNINNTPANPFVIQNLTVTNSATIVGTLSAGATSVSSLSSGATALFNNASIAGTLSVFGTSTLGLTNTGNLGVTGTINASGLISANNGLTITGALTLPVASQLKYQIISLYISSLLGTDSIVSVIPAKITGTIVEITAISNDILSTDDAIFTCSIINSGVDTNITNGAPIITPATELWTPVTVIPSGNNTLITNSVIKCQISGGNLTPTSGTITFKVLVA